MRPFPPAITAFFAGIPWGGNPKVEQVDEWFVLSYNGVPMARRCQKHVEITGAGLPFEDEVKELVHGLVEENGDMRLTRVTGEDGQLCWVIKQLQHHPIPFDPTSTGWTLIAAGSVFEQLGAIEDQPEVLPDVDSEELDFF